MYVYIYVCIYVCMYIYIYVSMYYVLMYVFTYVVVFSQLTLIYSSSPSVGLMVTLCFLTGGSVFLPTADK